MFEKKKSPTEGRFELETPDERKKNVRPECLRIVSCSLDKASDNKCQKRKVARHFLPLDTAFLKSVLDLFIPSK